MVSSANKRWEILSPLTAGPAWNPVIKPPPQFNRQGVLKKLEGEQFNRT